MPGVARDYTATLAADVTSTAGNATLTMADATGVASGHLVNGAFSLPQPLQVRADGGAYRTLPAALLTFDGPVTHDPVEIAFKQSIGASDALRTGNYAKTLTLTSSTTEP